MMMQTTLLPKCRSWGGKHRFEPRYSTRTRALTDAEVEVCLDGDDLAGVMEEAREETYEGDVCTRCGLAVRMPERAR